MILVLPARRQKSKKSIVGDIVDEDLETIVGDKTFEADSHLAKYF